jgi:hypothetical protein
MAERKNKKIPEGEQGESKVKRRCDEVRLVTDFIQTDGLIERRTDEAGCGI